MKRFLFALLLLAAAPALAKEPRSALEAKARSGDVQAQYQLGYNFAQAENYGPAAKWYAMAAENGHMQAERRLAVFYETGHGVEMNYAKAAAWYRKAASQGDKPSQYALGDIYKKGVGVRQDHEEACFWFLLAGDEGEAMFEASHFSPAALEKIRQRAQAWKPVKESPKAAAKPAP